MNEFFRFPHTPHLTWLGDGSPRDDKILSVAEMASLLKGDVVVEEKLDGANIGFSLGADGRLLAQNRGQYLVAPYAGQFARLSSWLAQHGNDLRAVLDSNLIVFGEWCAARHSLDYVALPDWFLIFDVYDRSCGRFWSRARRDGLAIKSSLIGVPQLLSTKTSLDALKTLVVNRPSHFREGALEGIVIRRETQDWCEARAKLVRPDFIQAIDTHWRKRAVEWNRIGTAIDATKQPN